MPRTIIKPRPYTEEDRKMLLSALGVNTFGGKSWSGSATAKHDSAMRAGQTEGRYGYTGDWPDLDRLT